MTLSDWNGGVLDNQAFLRQQGVSGYKGRFSNPGSIYLVSPSSQPTWDLPVFSQPIHGMTDAVARNQYVSGSTSSPCPPAIIRRTGIYRVVVRAYAQHNLPVPLAAAGPTSGDVNLALVVNSSISSTAGPFGGPQQNDVIAAWPGASSNWDSDFKHHGETVRRFENGDIIRLYMGQLSTGGRSWGCELDLNYLGAST